jgi:hypothetical protein
MTKVIIRFLLFSMLILASIGGVAAQLKGDATVTLEGQVVCSSCWFEADRKEKPYGDEGDLKCAVDCMKKGKSQALAVESSNGLTLYLLEPGKLKRDRKDWLDFIAKPVKTTGTVREADGKRFLQVDSIEVVSPDTKHEKPGSGQGDSEVQ